MSDVTAPAIHLDCCLAEWPALTHPCLLMISAPSNSYTEQRNDVDTGAGVHSGPTKTRRRGDVATWRGRVGDYKQPRRTESGPARDTGVI